MKLEEEKILGFSKKHDNRIFLLLVLIVVLLAGLYVVNFREQRTSAQAGFGCPAGQFPMPIKAGVNLCSVARRAGTFVYTPGSIGALSTTYQCCIADNPLSTPIANFRDTDNAYCRSKLSNTNVYCSKNRGLNPKCEGSDTAISLSGSTINPQRCGVANSGVCCLPKASGVTRAPPPRTTAVPVVTSVPVATSVPSAYTYTCEAGLYPLRSDQAQDLQNQGFCKNDPRYKQGYGKYLWNGFYGTQAKCYVQFTKLCSTTSSGYVRKGSIRCLNSDTGDMRYCISASPTLLADFDSNAALSCPSGSPKYVKDSNGKCYLEGGQLMTSSLNNKKFCVNKLVDSATSGCQSTPPVCTGGSYSWGGLNPVAGQDTCYRLNAQYNSSAGYCVQKEVASDYCACKVDGSTMSICAGLPANP